MSTIIYPSAAVRPSWLRMVERFDSVERYKGWLWWCTICDRRLEPAPRNLRERYRLPRYGDETVCCEYQMMLLEPLWNKIPHIAEWLTEVLVAYGGVATIVRVRRQAMTAELPWPYVQRVAAKLGFEDAARSDRWRIPDEHPFREDRL